MAVALSVHLRHPAMRSLQLASPAIVDGTVFLGLLLIGPGKYSIDKK